METKINKNDIKCNVMSFRSISSSGRFASDMEAMTGRIYDVYHSTRLSRQLADCLRRVVGHRFQLFTLNTLVGGGEVRVIG